MNLWDAVTHGLLQAARKHLEKVPADKKILFGAIDSGQDLEMVELLLQHVRLPDEEANACRMAQAIETDNAAAVKQWLLSGIDPDFAFDTYGRRPLHRARSARVARLLIDAGADVNGRNRFGESPIFYASGEVTKVLLEAGADATITGCFGQTALLTSTSAPKVRMLLAAGANPLAVGADKDTPLHRVEDAESVAIYAGLGVDVNARNILGDTPLFHQSNQEVFKALLAAGADPCAVNKEGATPLHHCTRPELAEILIAAGALVNAEDKKGRTPLHRALCSPYAQSPSGKRLIATLIQAGATKGSGKTGRHRS